MPIQAEAQEFISTCDCPEFLRKAEKRLIEESERVTNYLDPSTESKVTRTVEETLIGQQVQLYCCCCCCCCFGRRIMHSHLKQSCAEALCMRAYVQKGIM